MDHGNQFRRKSNLEYFMGSIVFFHRSYPGPFLRVRKYTLIRGLSFIPTNPWRQCSSALQIQRRPMTPNVVLGQPNQKLTPIHAEPMGCEVDLVQFSRRNANRERYIQPVIYFLMSHWIYECRKCLAKISFPAERAVRNDSTTSVPANHGI